MTPLLILIAEILLVDPYDLSSTLQDHSFESHITRFHSVFHSCREHGGTRLSIRQRHAIVINVPLPSASNLVSTWLSGVGSGRNIRST